MQRSNLTALLEAYRRAPAQYQATSYWQSYERSILDTIAGMDERELRSGKYPILATFGFGDVLHVYHPNQPWLKRALLKCLHLVAGMRDGRRVLPYGLSISDLRRMAYRHCELVSTVTGAPSIDTIEASDFGHPADLFEIDGRKYTVAFLTYYIRHCFAHRHARLRGDETVVELGSGSGYQIEVLKKLHPRLTVLCFDLPLQIHLCEGYLSESLGTRQLIGADTTLTWTDLSRLELGKVHCFGNWQFPLLAGFSHDLFWNAASFGEMEPDVVANYLSFVRGQARHVYLCQARHGKQTRGRTRVQTPITFKDYKHLLAGYDLLAEEDSYQACRPISESGGYFQAVWRRSSPDERPSGPSSAA